MKLYIAGPMSGRPDSNYPAFFGAARDLTACGFEVINPARSSGQEHCHTWQDYMRRGLRDLADCDAVATLPGWAESRGAALEVHVARSLTMPVRSVDEWLHSRSDTYRQALVPEAAEHPSAAAVNDGSRRP
jgi:hypothetical protein